MELKDLKQLPQFHPAEAYANQLAKLLPPGDAFESAFQGDFKDLLLGLGDELSTMEWFINLVSLDLHPLHVNVQLDEWEEALGLPDSCYEQVLSSENRQKAILEKFIFNETPTKQFFIDLAARYDVEITITEPQPFRAGSTSGERCYGWEWQFAFIVNSTTGAGVEYLTAGGEAGDPLAFWGDAQLECLINQHRPEHTTAIFSYSEA